MSLDLVSIDGVDGRPTALYRLYAADGAYLYVGVSIDLHARFHAHGDDKPDWTLVARIDLVWYDSRVDALAAELEAIRTERPAWNVRDNPKPPRGTWLPDICTRDQVVRDVEGKIVSGEWPVGSMMPTIGELSRAYQCSTNTVSAAMSKLRDHGFLMTGPRRRSYICWGATVMTPREKWEKERAS